MQQAAARAEAAGPERCSLKAYHLTHWDRIHENNDSRKVEGPLTWVKVPTGKTGEDPSRTYLLQQKGGFEALGVYDQLRTLAARCSPRGWFIREGHALTLPQIAAFACIPLPTLRRALKLLEDDRFIGWVEQAEPPAGWDAKPQQGGNANPTEVGTETPPDREPEPQSGGNPIPVSSGAGRDIQRSKRGKRGKKPREEQAAAPPAAAACMHAGPAAAAAAEHSPVAKSREGGIRDRLSAHAVTGPNLTLRTREIAGMSLPLDQALRAVDLFAELARLRAHPDHGGQGNPGGVLNRLLIDWAMGETDVDDALAAIEEVRERREQEPAAA